MRICSAASSAVDSLPILDWNVRSDWRNVRTACNAKGDGKVDDTAAIQVCINNMTNGETLYLPPGVYKITKTLEIGCKNVTFVDPKAHENKSKLVDCLIGGNIKGHGATTRVVWAGAPNETMLLDTGITGFRSMGVVWDGAGVAGVGFAHQSIHVSRLAALNIPFFATA